MTFGEFRHAMARQAAGLSHLVTNPRWLTVRRPCSGGEYSLRVLTELGDSNARVADRIRDVQSTTEREVLACGSVLATIVGKARDLTGESERAAASSMARSEQITARFVEGMREDILAQEAAVKRALDLAGGIEEAIATINNLMLFSKMLALNAKIESARLGEQGRAFEVVADGLSGLSEVIRAASDTVTSAIGAVREGLPPISARAASMDERTRHFVDEVAEQVRSASLRTDADSGGGLDALMELSNQALSHLQFQDPMSQQLLSIDRDLDFVKDRVQKVLNGDRPEARETGEPAFGDEPAPGEIMLF